MCNFVWNIQCYLLLQKLEEAMGDDTVLVSIMTVNNEIGVRQPVEEIGNNIRVIQLECTV